MVPMRSKQKVFKGRCGFAGIDNCWIMSTFTYLIFVIFSPQKHVNRNKTCLAKNSVNHDQFLVYSRKDPKYQVWTFIRASGGGFWILVSSPKGSRDATYCIYKSAVLIHVGCFVGNNDDVSNKHLHQGKWWLAAGMVATTFQASSCFLALPPTPASSLTYLKEGNATASPSCLGGGWSSVGDLMVVTTFTLAFLGLQATPAGLPSTLWGASQ